MTVDMNMRVLIADDHKVMRGILRDLLVQLKFNSIDEAADGGEALDMLREKSYGLVISDWSMDTMSGFELLQEVRADRNLRGLPFIIMSAESKPENVVAAKKAGVSSFIVKPFSTNTLRAKMISVLGEF